MIMVGSRNYVSLIGIVVLLSILHVMVSALGLEEAQPQQQLLLLGVSGTLQDGFPLRDRMDFRVGENDESKALFIGKGLVRGYKAYLDIKQKGWREYVPEPELPPINHVVLPSGCNNHGNIFWIYAIDARQVLTVLNHEPRFLGISPDTGLIDLDATETSQKVRDFVHHEIRRQGKTDMKFAAIPLVTGVWYHNSYVPSPPIVIKDDGTEVTSFEKSLVLWAQGVEKKDMIDNTSDNSCRNDNSTMPSCGAAAEESFEYDASVWERIGRAIRRAEKDPPSQTEVDANGPPFQCSNRARFGVGPETARINHPLTRLEIMTITDNYQHE